MKQLFILFFITFSIIVVAQTDDPKATIAGLSGGLITKKELLSQENLVPNSKDIVIIEFTMSYPIGDDDVVELLSNSDKITKEMKDHIDGLKTGSELSFENIKAKKGNSTIILEAINLKIKE
jgi:hypothetical protein